MTLKAICLGKVLASTSWPGTYMPLVWSQSSSIASLPAPLTDW